MDLKSRPKTIRRLSWDEVRRELDAIDLSGFSHVAGVVRGGLPPAVVLSKRLGAKMPVVYTGRGEQPPMLVSDPVDTASIKKLLVVDELATSGETIHRLAKALDGWRTDGLLDDWSMLVLVLDHDVRSQLLSQYAPRLITTTFDGVDIVQWPWDQYFDRPEDMIGLPRFRDA